MDDDSHGEYARAPTLDDLLAICRSLADQGARYVLIGGFAVVLHGFVRTTKDIDLLVDASDENIRRIKRALSILPDRAIELIADDEVRRYTVVRIADEVVIDLLEKACGIDYTRAEQDIEWIEVEGVPVPVASKALLIRTKQTVRPSDQADVDFLRLRIELEAG